MIVKMNEVLAAKKGMNKETKEENKIQKGLMMMKMMKIKIKIKNNHKIKVA